MKREINNIIFPLYSTSNDVTPTAHTPPIVDSHSWRAEYVQPSSPSLMKILLLPTPFLETMP